MFWDIYLNLKTWSDLVASTIVNGHLRHASDIHADANAKTHARVHIYIIITREEPMWFIFIAKETGIVKRSENYTVVDGTPAN